MWFQLRSYATTLDVILCLLRPVNIHTYTITTFLGCGVVKAKCTFISFLVYGLIGGQFR